MDMHDDNDFRDLLKGGFEKASPEFTRNVMAGIEQLNTSKAASKSLVSARWKRVYATTFIAVALIIIVLSFAIKPTEIPSIDFKLQAFPIPSLQQLIVYIIGFWALVFLSLRMNKKNESY